MRTYHCDLLSVGAGLAGERVAIAGAEAGFDVICLSIVPARRSHSSAAQGGMQAALANCAKGEGDSPDVHFADTVKGSDWGADQEVARMFADMAPVVMREMAHWGVPWNRVVPGKGHYYKGGERFEKEEKKEKEGLITARAFGGTAKWRTCYTSDGTGHTVLYTMDNRAAQLGVKVHDKIEAISIIHDGTTCMGVVARDLKTGELVTYLSRVTLIASGGAGRLYRESTNAIINQGGGHIIALDTEVVPLANMEAIQFHPTGIVPTNILVTEGCRGDGGNHTALAVIVIQYLIGFCLVNREKISEEIAFHTRQLVCIRIALIKCMLQALAIIVIGIERIVPSLQYLIGLCLANREKIGATKFAVDIRTRTALEATDTNIPISSGRWKRLVKVNTTMKEIRSLVAMFSPLCLHRYH